MKDTKWGFGEATEDGLCAAERTESKNEKMKDGNKVWKP